MGTCQECPGIQHLQEKLELHFGEKMIDQIEIRQWTTTDRSTLETIILPVDDFLRIFLAALSKVVMHDFIAKQQANYLQATKNALRPGEFVVFGDFAENYSFVVQDAARSFHWNNLQATIHPFVCYYRDENDARSAVNDVSFVVISENNGHDTVAVHLFQKLLINFLIEKIGEPSKIFYFSDDCAAQYKNRKNFINLCHHEEDFSIPAEWHFFATSHGKGPCDGVGGTVKRLAARASLQRPYDKQILTPHQLFEFAQSEIKGINFYYATVFEYEQESSMLEHRFQLARTIPGTHRLHSFVPLSAQQVEVRDFSSSLEKRIERIWFSWSTCPYLTQMYI